LSCGIFELRDLGTHARTGALRDSSHILFAGEQRLQHLPRAAAQHIGRDRRQLDIGGFEDLLQAVGFLRSRLRQALAIAC
jgi:hypothetical protein